MSDTADKKPYSIGKVKLWKFTDIVSFSLSSVDLVMCYEFLDAERETVVTRGMIRVLNISILVHGKDGSMGGDAY